MVVLIAQELAVSTKAFQILDDILATLQVNNREVKYPARLALLAKPLRDADSLVKQVTL